MILTTFPAFRWEMNEISYESTQEEGTVNEQKFRDYGLLWLRLALGCAIFFLHGWGRVPRVYNYLVLGQPWTFVNLVGKIGFPVPSFFALASAFSEVVGGLLIISGLFTRWAAGLFAINIGVAVYFELSKGGEGAELPLIYLIAICAIVIAGPGPYSLDAMRRRRSGERAMAAGASRGLSGVSSKA